MKKYATAAVERPIAARAERAPPYQAATITAPFSSRNGRCIVATGPRASFAATAPPTVRTASANAGNGPVGSKGRNRSRKRRRSRPVREASAARLS